MMSWLGLRSCGPSSPHQLSESRPCIRRRPYIDPTEAAGGRRRRTDREEGHPRNVVCEPPTYTHRVLNPLCYSSIQGETHTVSQTRRGKSSCRHPMCWAVRSTASKPWSSAPTSWSRSAETPSASRSPHAVQWHCERRVLLNGNVVV